MKIIKAKDIEKKIYELCGKTCIVLPDDVKNRINESLENETNDTAKEVLNEIIKNYHVAEQENLPLCQDTGVAIFFVEIGDEVYIEGNLTQSINAAVAMSYKDHYLRKSIVKDPIDRVNTQNNTPAIIHIDIVTGDQLKITFCPKGGGSENMSRIAMLKPADGWDGIENFVIDTVKKAGPNPCPPIIVGIGIGGTFDYAPILAKKSLARELDDKNNNLFYAEKEKDLLTKINNLNIGPAGFGGKTTALSVKINAHPCHIASMPVAVNIQCHSARHGQVIL